MGVSELFLITGTGRKALEHCYELLGIRLDDLPDDPEQFIAAGRHDGLVTYYGETGPWEATIRMPADQPAKLHTIPGVRAQRQSL